MSPLRTLAKKVANYHDPHSVGARLRRRRLAPLLAMIDEVYRERGAVRIIDIGGTRTYWKIVPPRLLEDRNVQVTIVNLPGRQLPVDEPHFAYVAADGCDLRVFPDRAFDIAHSNSVIEHVGDWHEMVRFSREVARVADRYFVQTPNFWFPLEPHSMTPFLHWLPKPFRVWMVRHFNLGHWARQDSVDAAVRTVESARLLTREMLQELFRDATISTERVLLLPKSNTAIRQ